MHKRFAYVGVMPAPLRFGVAIGLAVLAVLARLSLDPLWGIKLPYITLFPAIMLAAWVGGFWPGVATTAISGAAAPSGACDMLIAAPERFVTFHCNRAYESSGNVIRDRRFAGVAIVLRGGRGSDHA